MKKIISLLCISGFVSTLCFAQTKNPLNLSKGQKYLVETKVETTSTTEVPGQTIDAKINVSTTYNIEVKDKSTNYNLSNTISNMKMNMSMMGQEMNFDSDKPEDMTSETGTALKDYINKPQDVEMDNTGNIIQNKSADSASANTGMFAKQVEAMKQSGYGTQFAFQSLPKDLKVGLTWSEKSDMGGISKSTDYTVKEINGNIATISLSGSISTQLTGEQQGMEVSTKTSGKFTGEEKIDITTGVILSNITTGDQKGTIEAMGNEMPTTSKATTTTTIKIL